MKVKMRKLNKKILSVVTVVCMLFTCMLSMKDAFAEESISIYNHSYGEVLKKISPEYYETLNDNVKEYYNGIAAEDVLGYEQNQDESILTDSIKQTKSPVLILVLTRANLERTSSSQMKFGGNYNSTYPCNMQCFAYLIRKSDGVIISSTFKTASHTVSESVSKTYKVNESKYEKYYCRAVGTYDTDNGVKTTSQNSLAKN